MFSIHNKINIKNSKCVDFLLLPSKLQQVQPLKPTHSYYPTVSMSQRGPLHESPAKLQSRCWLELQSQQRLQ